MDTRLVYCRDKAAPDGSDRYYALHFHPPDEYRPLLALFTLQTELEYVLQTIEDPGVARIKLEWWRNEIDACRQQKPRHPLTQLLAEHLPQQPDANLYPGLLQWIDLTEKSLQQPDNETRLACQIERQQQAWLLATQLCGTPQEPLPRLMTSAASQLLTAHSHDLTRRRESLLALNETLQALQQQDSPLCIIILCQLGCSALKKTGHTELLPIHKLWIAWRCYRRMRRFKRGENAS